MNKLISCPLCGKQLIKGRDSDDLYCKTKVKSNVHLGDSFKTSHYIYDENVNDMHIEAIIGDIAITYDYYNGEGDLRIIGDNDAISQDDFLSILEKYKRLQVFK